MKLYTLRQAMGGSRGELLNGKIFAVKKGKGQSGKDHAMFINATDNKPIWETSGIVNIVYTTDGVKIITRNTIYDLIDLQFLIPTNGAKIDIDDDIDNEDLYAMPIPTLEAIDCKTDIKPIHYGDGYVMNTYTFNRICTKEEFIKFLEESNYGLTGKTKETAAWWESYDVIIPGESDKVWSIKRVDRYTD